MLFSKNIIRSFVDLPDHTSMIIHSIGCNLHCYKCFNYESLVANPKDTGDANYILNQIKLNGFLFDALILSGGEFLTNNKEEVIHFINKLKDVFDGLIIINTNGTPNKTLKSVVNLVDGIHMDIKIPPNYPNDLVKEIMGVKIYGDIWEQLEDSINTIMTQNSPYSQFRTIKYPQLKQNDFDLIKQYIRQKNQQHHSNIPWYLNEFMQ